MSRHRIQFITTKREYEGFFNLREDFTCSLHDFTCMLLSITLQDVDTKGNPVLLTEFFY